MWTVYRRYNTITRKSYIGITHTTIDKRWELDRINAQKLQKLKLSIEGKKYPNDKVLRKIRRAEGTVAMDLLLMGEQCWEHTVLETHESFVMGLLAERRLIIVYDSQDPAKGYNRSAGGELPRYCTITQLINELTLLTDEEKRLIGI